MMSHTFEEVRRSSTLQCRTSYARCVVRYELVAASFGMQVAVGELESSGMHVHKFRIVERNSEGFRTGGTSDPFYDGENALAERDDEHQRESGQHAVNDPETLRQLKTGIVSELEMRIAKLLKTTPCMGPCSPSTTPAVSRSTRQKSVNLPPLETGAASGSWNKG
mmetsp:Transcript_21387/g.54758  ORF Transcript_21387/g.54758 Transcript_21387/m.54758 type:complete len:165 (+) Transcript_21387:127-621(+)